ncbi:MAG: hypothetical protein CENE_02946 [Candidatus Celerinatantimonas neptuna]|nr:MAG: hypothetical protein CENE_02946 [Candidatus Celerinatantimonas neptuna]
MEINRRDFLSLSLLLGANLLLPNKASAGISERIFLTGYDKLIKNPIGILAQKVAVELSLYNQEWAYHLKARLGNHTMNAPIQIKESPADGRSILLAVSPQMTIFPAIYKQLPYNPLEDFTPLVLLGGYTFLITLGPVVDRSVKTIDDYVDWVLEHPNYRDIGFAQYGSSGHMAMKILSRSKKIALRPLPYRDFPPLIQDLKSSNLAAAIILTGIATPLFKKNIFRAIAATSRHRHLGWEDVPTAREQGIPNMNISGWAGLFLHSQTPHSIYQPLLQSMQEITDSLDYIARLRKYSLIQLPDTPERISKRIVREQKYYQRLVENFRFTRL